MYYVMRASAPSLHRECDWNCLLCFSPQHLHKGIATSRRIFVCQKLARRCMRREGADLYELLT